MKSEIVLKSENAIEAFSNKEKIGKSLVDLFKNLCVNPSINPSQMSVSSNYARPKVKNGDGFIHSNNTDCSRYRYEEVSIKFNDGAPEIVLTKEYNNEYTLKIDKVKKPKFAWSTKDKWKLLLFQIPKMNDETFTFKGNNPKAYISHGGINLEVTSEMFDMLKHFHQEQKETKLVNGEIERLSDRLDEFGVKNPLNKK
jgi:hypothetical protein